MGLGNRRTAATVVAALALVTGLLWVGPGAAGAPPPTRQPRIITEAPGVVTSPTATNGRAMAVHIFSPFYDGTERGTATWSLVDSDEDVVIGPKPLSPTEDRPGGSVFLLDPTAENDGVALPDGTYSFSVTFTYDDGTGPATISTEIDVQLAQTPPQSPTSRLVLHYADLHPGERPVKASIREMPGTGHFLDDGDPPATLTVTDLSGAPVAHVEGYQDCVCDDNTTDIYEFQWDGTSDAGTAQPPGRYDVTATVTDAWSRQLTTDPQPVWINHLTTKSKTLRYVPTETAWSSYNRIGTCSSAPSPGPNNWAGSIAIMSKSTCASSAGTKDWAFRSFRLDSESDDQQRLISVKAGVYGTPVRSGMKGAIAYATTLSKTPAWKSFGTLSGGLGWHDAATYTVPTTYASGPYRLRTQARVTEGNQWDIKFWRVTWTYRAWTR